MNAKNEEGLYGALEEALKKAGEPLECAALFDMPSVRKHANTVNRVSDYLGNLWRKGKVLRLPAPRLDNTRARWMYMWKPATKKPKPDLSEAIEFDGNVGALLSRPHLEITEEGNTVVLTLDKLTITIQRKE